MSQPEPKRLLMCLIMIVPLLASLIGCGNKGDLFLIPDEFSEEDLQQLEQALETEDMPGAEPVDVDDQYQVDDSADDKPRSSTRQPAAQ